MLSLIVRPVRCSCSSVTRLALGFFPTHSIPILIPPPPPKNIPDSPFLLTPFSFRFGNLCIDKKATQHNSHRTAPVHAADQLTLSGTSLLRVKTPLLFSTRYTRPKRNDEKNNYEPKFSCSLYPGELHEESSLNKQTKKKE